MTSNYDEMIDRHFVQRKFSSLVLETLYELNMNLNDYRIIINDIYYVIRSLYYLSHTNFIQSTLTSLYYAIVTISRKGSDSLISEKRFHDRSSWITMSISRRQKAIGRISSRYLCDVRR